MDLTLYRLLVQQLSPQPDLSLIKQGELLPEVWPVVLDKIITYRKKIQYVTVTDGKTSIQCHSDVPDLYDRIATYELGTIIHLLGARTVFQPAQRGYIVLMEDFMTLKQYDEHLREVREAEARRLADLHDELAEYQNISYRD
jgi:hypothetical protein